MNFFSDILGGRSILRDRIDWILCQPAPPPASEPTNGRHELRVRRLAAEDHLYFSIRPFASNGRRNILQYAFADDRGNVVMSAFGCSQAPVGHPTIAPPDDLAVDPVDPEALEYLLTRLCGGSTLVGFGRVLQAGLLPYSAIQGSASVECAWRRFLQVARRRGLRLERGRPVTLADALRLAGLRPLESDDAALRALAIRDLWAWMDCVD